MRVDREYAFKVINKVGKTFTEGGMNAFYADRLWSIQKQLSYKDITPKQAVREVYELVEYSSARDKWGRLLRMVAL